MTRDYKSLEDLVKIDSPTGFTATACDFIFTYLKNLGFHPEYTRKGAVKCKTGQEPTIAIAAHVDTLGAIVSGVRSDGTLTFSTIGGLSLSSAEGEYVKIYTMTGKVYNGTLLLNNPSSHANATRENDKRTIDNMHIRVDEEICSKKDVEDLGIKTGDFICFDPRYQEFKNGFIKSRFMDNKAGCFVLFEIARYIKENGLKTNIELFFSNYEEVGHGGAGGYAPSIKDLLVIDMGVLGDACTGKETSCSICVKDSSGPYDYSFRTKLVEIAGKKNIPVSLDVYPFYGSDGSAALRAGNDFRVALIGPGVAASHGVERTHKKGIDATIDLCIAYLEDLT